MSNALVEAVADRIESALGTARTVYRGAVPDGTLPARYVVVWGAVGTSTSSNLSGLTDGRDAPVWVTSVAANTDASVGAYECLWAQERAVAALADFRPAVGQAAFRLVHLASQPPSRDESRPDATVMSAVDQFGATYQP